MLRQLSSRRRLLSGFAAAAAVSVLPLQAGAAAANTTIQLTSPADAAQAARSGQWKVLDVRPVPPLDYVAGHIPNAVHISEQAFRGSNGRLPYQIWPYQIWPIC